MLYGPAGDDLSQLLRDLAERVAMPSWVAGTVGDVSRSSGRLSSMTPTLVWLLHNLDRPLLEQLDPGPVTELRLAAPFVDSSGSAVHALLGRIRPSRRRMALQHRLCSVSRAGSTPRRVVKRRAGAIAAARPRGLSGGLT